MNSRRNVLKSLVTLPLVGGVLTQNKLLQSDSLGLLRSTTRDYFKELGIRTFINAAGTYTSMTGSLMAQEVVEAINYASHEYVNLDELHDKIGKRIAELLDCEAATVTSGCFGAMSIAMAGVMCGNDPEKVKQLPNTDGLKNEVIIQEAHSIGYSQALTNVGAKIVKIKTAQELESSINEKTAMLWFLNANTEEGEIKWAEFIEIGKKFGVPTFIDCAADVPPVDNLFRFTKMGFDMVAFSGGKGLRGPQSAGLLLGKKEFIQYARLHTPPRGETIGRGMKVNKEEVVGLLAALELYLNKNHKKEWELWESQINLIANAAKSIAGVDIMIHVPPHANHVPSLKIKWDQNKIRVSPNQFREMLRNGDPSIETVGDDTEIGITTWMMVPGQESIVADKIQMLLNNYSV